MMTETLVNSFATLFVIIDPIGLLPIFLGVTAGADGRTRRRVALVSVGVALIVLILFAFFGENLLAALGVSMPAFRIAGGIMLFLIALEMLFEKRTERRHKSVSEFQESAEGDEAFEDVAIFPLAVPLIAGPGAIASMILLVSDQEEAIIEQIAIVGVMAGVLLITLAVFLLAHPLERLIGERVTKVVTRLLGIILGAIAVQFVLSGIAGVPFVNG